MKRLSIIVPIHNAEPYIERCLRSIENQDIPKSEYEVVCINDGSLDNSREIVKLLQEEFNNIILIDQNNKGVAVARNKGIDSARGKYIMMVDADDYLKDNILKEKLNTIEAYDLDIGISGYYILNQDLQEEYCYDPPHDPENVLTGIEFDNKYQHGKSEIRDPHRSVAIFLKTGFINSQKLRYLAGVPYLEDGEFISRAICLGQRVSFLNGPIYYRTTIPGSATKSRLRYSQRARDGFLKSAHNLLQFKHNRCINEEQQAFINQSIVHFTVSYLTTFEKLEYTKQYSKIYELLKKGPLKKLETIGCSKQYKRLANSYNFSIHTFYFFWWSVLLRKTLTIRLKKLFFF